jgi:hypothetical protein
MKFKDYYILLDAVRNFCVEKWVNCDYTKYNTATARKKGGRSYLLTLHITEVGKLKPIV